jgi:hypothetical protein
MRVNASPQRPIKTNARGIILHVVDLISLCTMPRSISSEIKTQCAFNQPSICVKAFFWASAIFWSS